MGASPTPSGSSRGLSLISSMRSTAPCPATQKVLAALDELLETGETSRLSRDKPPKRTGWFRGEPQAQIEKARWQDEVRLRDLARQLRSRSAAPDASAT